MKKELEEERKRKKEDYNKDDDVEIQEHLNQGSCLFYDT